MEKPVLTCRERECLEHLANGVLPKNIAVNLGLSEASVRLHLSRAKKRLGCTTMVQAATRATKTELIVIR